MKSQRNGHSWPGSEYQQNNGSLARLGQEINGLSLGRKTDLVRMRWASTCRVSRACTVVHSQVWFKALTALVKFPPYGWVHSVTRQLSPLRLPAMEGGKERMHVPKA